MKDLRTFIGIIKKIYYILNSKQKRQAIFIVCIILIASVFEMIGISSVMPFVQAINEPYSLKEQSYIKFFISFFDLSDDKQLLIATGLGIIFIYLLKNLIITFSVFCQVRYKTRLFKELTVFLMRSYTQRPYEFFTNTNSAEILNGINADAGNVYDILEILMKMLSELLTVIIIGIYLIIVDFYMALGILIVGIVCIVSILLTVKRPVSKAGQTTRMAGIEQNKSSLQIIYGIKEILLTRKTDFFLNSFENAKEKYRFAKTVYEFLGAIPERIIETVCIGGIIGVVLLRVMMGVDTVAFISSLAVFAMAAFRIMPSISRISGQISGIIFARQGLEAAYTNICEAKDYVNKQRVEMLDINLQNQLSFDKEIKVEHCVWEYKQGKGLVLNDANMVIGKGMSVGIIGESGSGKSTLIDILLGLYQPKSGRVRMDDYDIYRIPYAWSRIIGYVPQNVYLLDDTIRANVAFGCPAAEIDDNHVWHVLEQANLAEYIRNLPEGLNTKVGERGIKFSGGQRQRIAIARALYGDPEILILDEATSALDNETEQAVMEAIDALHGTMTLIMVAHRLTTLKGCNCIYEVVKGKIEKKI